MSYVSEVLADSPLGYWRQGDASGTTMTDSSGNGRNGTYVNSPTLAQSGALSSDPSDTAVLYDGSNDRADTTWGSWQNVTDITVEAWIKTTASGSDRMICARDGNSGHRIFDFLVNSTGKLVFTRRELPSGSTSLLSATSTVNVNDGNWHHVAATFDQTTIQLYIDGSPENSATAGPGNGGLRQSATAIFQVACKNNGGPNSFFSGTIDEVAYYGTVLSAARLAAHHTASSSITVAGALATETDEALAGGITITVPGSIATETDQPLAGSVANFLWSADLVIGDHEFTITSECDLDDEETIYVLDGLRIGWEVSESDPWPAQPQPVQFSVQLYTLQVSDLDDVFIGTPISCVLTNSASLVLATFHGRVAQMSATTVRRSDDIAMRYTIQGVDYTVDLEELPIITTGFAAETADDRFTNIATTALAAGSAPITGPTDVDTAAFEAVDAGTYTAGALLADHLRQVAVDVGDGLQRNIVVPVVVDEDLDHYEAVLQDRVVDASLLPGTFEVVEGVLTLVFTDLTADGVVDACNVDLDTTWNRLKYRAVNRVTVTSNTFTVEATRPGPPVRLNLTSTLTDEPAGERMAELYLPDVDETNGWVADPFHLYAYRDQSQILPAWFPDHRQDPPETSVYVMPIVLVNVPEDINLSGSYVYAGQLAAAVFEIRAGKTHVEFSLRRQLPAGVGNDAASWEWAFGEFPSVAWEDIDPGLSWYEARLGKAV